MGVTASSRLRTQREFQQVRNQGIRILCGPFIFQALQHSTGVGSSQFGVIASRRVGNAVKRNLGKRRFRELFRRHEKLLPGSAAVVVVLRSSFDQHTFSDLEGRFVRACSNFARQCEAALEDTSK